MKTSNKLILMGAGCILIAIILTLSLDKSHRRTAQQLTKAVVVKHAVTEFTEIDIAKNIRVNFTQSNITTITVLADSAMQEAVGIRIVGKRLFITIDNETDMDLPVEIQVKAPLLTNISLREGASFRTADSLILDVLSVNSTSGSDLFIRGLIDSLYVETSAGSVANIEGIANKLTVRSISGSRFNADSLRVAHCVAEATSGAVQNLCVSHSFDVSSETNAQINYHGNPKIRRYESANGGLLLKK